MPFVKQKTLVLQENTELMVWKIEETPSFFLEKLELLPTDLEKCLKMPISRQLEWLAGRYLSACVNPSGMPCQAQPNRKPYYADYQRELSLSHSGGYVALLVSPVAVGIDIQAYTEKVTRVAHKFLRAEEFASVEQDDHHVEHLLAYWGAKESLFKAYGAGEVDFRKHLSVTPFGYTQKGRTVGEVQKGGFRAVFDIHYEFDNEQMLVYCIEQRTTGVSSCPLAH